MSIWIKKFCLLFLLFSFVILATGCWDNRDLTKRSFISGIGLDITKDNKIELTLQLVKASEIGKESKSSSKEAVWVHSTTGDTVHEAVRNQFTTVNRKPFYSHVQVIVIGEELARKGIKDILDFFERDHETRLTPFISIAKGTTAKSIMNARSDLETIPAIHLKGISESANVNLAILDSKLSDVCKYLGVIGRNATLSTLEIVNNNEDLKIEDIKIEGAAIFKKDKLVGWLNLEETKGLKYIDNKAPSGIVNVPNPLDKNKTVSLEQQRCKGRVDVNLEGNTPMFIIEVKAEGVIGTVEGNGEIMTPEMIKKLEKEAESVIKQQIQTVIDVAQKKYKSDIFGFGTLVYQKHLNYWKQEKENWTETFCNVPSEINVKFKINNTGLINEAIKIK